MSDMLEIFGDERNYINKDNFFPKKHWVKVRPSDKEALFNRVMKDSVLYGLFFDFLFMKAYDKEFIENEIRFVVENNTNLVALLIGTVGSGKSQLSRGMAKLLAYERGMNIRFIINKKIYDKSNHKEGSIKVILNPNFTKIMDCYITYSFFETTNLVKILNPMDMIIQDEVDKSMGTDSKLIKIKVSNVLAINARRNKISVIFNTPCLVQIKNLNIVIEVFGVKNNGKFSLTRNNMITFGILFDKNVSPFSIASFRVWETGMEHEFYEANSLKEKDKFKSTGGGKTVNPDKEIVEKYVELLFKSAAADGITKQRSLECHARYTPELEGMESGMLKDVIAFTWDKYDQWLNDGVDPGFEVKFKAKKKIDSPIKKKKEKEEKKETAAEKALKHPETAISPVIEKLVEKVEKKEESIISRESFIETLDKNGFVLNGKTVYVEKDGTTNIKVRDLEPEIASSIKELRGIEIMTDDTVITRQFLIDWYDKSVKEIEKSVKVEEPAEEESTRKRAVVISGEFTREHLVPKTQPLLDYVSKRVREDFGVYQQRLWDMIVGSGMGYDEVADRLKKEGVIKSHMTVGNDFMEIREGSEKDGKPIGIGYYGEQWWANEHNDETYRYDPPGNDSVPDYIHKDGTVDSIKSYYAFRAIYLKPIEDCRPEIEYCRKNDIKFFRVVIFNFKQSTTDVVIKLINVNDVARKFKINPNHFKAY